MKDLKKTSKGLLLKKQVIQLQNSMIATCQAPSWFPYIIISFNSQKKSSQNPTLFLHVRTVRLGVDQCCVETVNLVSLRSGAVLSQETSEEGLNRTTVPLMNKKAFSFYSPMLTH